MDILAQLRGTDVPLDDPAVLRKKAEIDETLALEQADGPWKLKECFVNGPLKIRRRYLLAIGKQPQSVRLCDGVADVRAGVQVMQQLSGINVLVRSKSGTDCLA